MTGSCAKDIYVLEPGAQISFGNAIETKADSDDKPNNLKIPVINNPLRGQPGTQDSFLLFDPNVEVVMVSHSLEVKAKDGKPLPFYDYVTDKRVGHFGTNDHPDVALYMRTTDGKLIRSSLDKYPNYLRVLESMESARKSDKAAEEAAQILIKPFN